MDAFGYLGLGFTVGVVMTILAGMVAIVINDFHKNN